MQEHGIERRNFLSGVAAGGAAAVVGGGSLAAGASSMGGFGGQLSKLTLDDFAPHVGDRFLLESESEGSVAVQLVQACPATVDADRPSNAPRRQGFSLLFRAAGNAPLSQENYTVRHGALGALGMFLVPVGPAGSSQQIEAVFG